MKFYQNIQLLFILFSVSMFANMGPQGFYKYPNKYFVETGSNYGVSIKKALSTNFQEVRSIDISPHYYNLCKELFAHDKRVKLYIGSSAQILGDVIADIREPITFWLDAHVYPAIKGIQNCPLIEELEHIKNHPIKTHTILIDDMHCASTLAFDYLSIEDLKEKILEINPNYTITFVPGGDDGEYPQNVLVAQVP